MADSHLSRRRFLKAASLSVGALALAACGTPQTTSSGDAPTTAPAAAGAGAGAGKNKTLQYYVGFGAGGNPEQIEGVKKIFDKFIASSETVQAIEPLVIPHAEAPRKFQTMVAGGTPPDVITMGMSQWDFAGKGSFVDIKPLATKDNIDLAQWDENALNGFTVTPRGNLLYGLPFGVNAQAIVYNKTLFEKLGVDPPPHKWDDTNWTWDAFIETAKRLTAGEGMSKTWGTIGIGGNWNLPWAYGGAWVDEAQEQIIIDQPEALNGFQLNYDLIHTHKVMPTQEEAKIMANGFLSGQVGMYVDGTWAAGTLMQIKDFGWDIAPVPYAQGADIKKRATPYYPDALVISSKNSVDESWDLIKFMILDDTNYQDFLRIMNQVPARKSQRDWFVNEFWKKEKADANWDGFLDGFNYAQVQRLFFSLNWSEVNNTQEADLSQLWLGQGTPAEVIPALDQKIQEIWTRGVEQLKQSS